MLIHKQLGAAAAVCYLIKFCWHRLYPPPHAPDAVGAPLTNIRPLPLGASVDLTTIPDVSVCVLNSNVFKIRSFTMIDIENWSALQGDASVSLSCMPHTRVGERYSANSSSHPVLAREALTSTDNMCA